MIGRNLKGYMSMSRFIMVVFVAAECGNDKLQTNADVPSRGLLRPCFARLLALLVGQPDAFGTGASPLGHDIEIASVSAATSAKVCG